VEWLHFRNLARHEIRGEHVGTDHQGNKYYRSKKIVPAGSNSPFAGMERRWVIYNGANDRAACPLNGTAGCTIRMTRCPRAICPAAHLGSGIHPNATGTAHAHRPHPELRAPAMPRATKPGRRKADQPHGTRWLLSAAGAAVLLMLAGCHKGAEPEVEASDVPQAVASTVARPRRGGKPVWHTGQGTRGNAGPAQQAQQ
jgi:NADH:ubiquinone oxidoreductase subunit